MTDTRESFVNEFNAVGSSGLPPEQAARQSAHVLQKWLIDKPNEMFSELRAQQPIFVPRGDTWQRRAPWPGRTTTRN